MEFICLSIFKKYKDKTTRQQMMHFAPFLFRNRGIDQKDMIQMVRLHDAHDIVRGWGPPAVGTTECATLALSSVLHDWIVLLAVLLLLLFSSMIQFSSRPKPVQRVACVVPFTTTSKGFA